MKSGTLNERIAEFKRWAQANLGRVHDLSASEAADELGEALLRIDQQLGVEIEEEVSDQRQAIITAFAVPSRFLLVQRIVAALQSNLGWQFIALKPPRGFEFSLTAGNDEILASELEYEPIAGIPGGIKLLVAPSVPLPDPDESEELAWLVVETGIGEELAGRLHHVEFASRRANTTASSIASLAEFARGLPPRTL